MWSAATKSFDLGVAENLGTFASLREKLSGGNFFIRLSGGGRAWHDNQKMFKYGVSLRTIHETVSQSGNMAKLKRVGKAAARSIKKKFG